MKRNIVIMPIRICAFLVFFFSSLSVFAQQDFVEGELVYSVSVRKSGENEQFNKAGTYSIFVKGSTIRKDIKLHNGYNNSIIINNGEGSVYSLKESAASKFAIQLSLQDLQIREKPFLGFTIIDEDGYAMIAGYKARKGKIKYKDGSEFPILYTKEFSITQPYMFNHLPGISGLPLLFEIANDDGTIMRFEAEKVVAKPVESAVFKIPADHKIISNEEYRQLSR